VEEGAGDPSFEMGDMAEALEAAAAPRPQTPAASGLRLVVTAGKKERPLVLKPEQVTPAQVLKLAQGKLKSKHGFLRTMQGELVDDSMLAGIKTGTKLILSKK
jgi:hypothetical protein